MRGAARQADIEAARAFGFGGSLWTHARPAGDGPAPRDITILADVLVLYAYRQAPGPIGSVAGATPVLADTWRYVLVSGSSDVLPGDIITSVDDAAYTFGIVSAEPWYDHAQGALERRR